MVDLQKIVTVVNRSPNMVVYRIPDTGVRRALKPNEPIRVAYEEMVKLSFRDGGRYILDNFLQVSDQEVIDELKIPVEPEYNMTQKDVENLLLNGSMDEFLDCLDFAPAGVINMIKQLALSMPLKNLDKREALKQKFGIDITEALKHKKEELDEENGGATPTVPNTQRRVQPAAPETPTRRTDGSKYNVVKKSEKTSE